MASIKNYLEDIKKYIENQILKINNSLKKIITLEKYSENYFKEKEIINESIDFIKSINLETSNSIISNIWGISIEDNTIVNILCKNDSSLMTKNIQPANIENEFYMTSMPIHSITRINFPNNYLSETNIKELKDEKLDLNMNDYEIALKQIKDL